MYGKKPKGCVCDVGCMDVCFCFCFCSYFSNPTKQKPVGFFAAAESWREKRLGGEIEHTEWVLWAPPVGAGRMDPILLQTTIDDRIEAGQLKKEGLKNYPVSLQRCTVPNHKALSSSSTIVSDRWWGC